MSPPILWQRWWPLLVAVVLTAFALLAFGNTVTNTSVTVAVAVIGVGCCWWIAEVFARQMRADRSQTPAVYPLHQAAAVPRGWLLTTPDAYGWLAVWLGVSALLPAAQTWLPMGAMPVVLGFAALAAGLMWFAASVVLAAIAWTRRSALVSLCLLVFVVLFVPTDQIGGRLGSSAVWTWLVYGDVVLVAAAAVWWSGTHPRSVDPRTEASA